MTFKVGDKVVFKPHLTTSDFVKHITSQEGVVVLVADDSTYDMEYPLDVDFGDGVFEAFTADGKVLTRDDSPSLFKIVQVDEHVNTSYQDILVKSILGSNKCNGHGQSQLAINARTDLELLINLCDALEKHLHQTEDFRGSVYVQIFIDYSWSIYAEDKLLVSGLD